MIEGFDKEIDALLRQTAKGETAFGETSADSRFQIPDSRFQMPNAEFHIPKSKIQNPKSKIHLDADEISAFAENALPEKTKLKYTSHFADCDRCRTILSNTISLNSEAEIVPASSFVSQAVSPQTADIKSVPWYRKIFAFPNTAYAMGALVVLFGGFFAFSLLQNFNNSQSREVSVISENQPKASGPSAESEPVFSAANTMSNMSVSSTNSASNAAMSNSGAVNMSNPSTMTSVANNAAAQRTNANLSAADMASVKKENVLNEAERAGEMDLARTKPAAPTSADSAAGSVAADQSVSSKQITALPKKDDERIITQAAPPASRVENLPLNGRSMNDLKIAKEKKSVSNTKESRAVSGKNFTRSGGVWYDSAYNGQTTTNISRGSNEYRKLDSGLRSIAENLSGTIVIVWKSKAFRIQ